MVSKELLEKAINFACGCNYFIVTPEELTLVGEYYGVEIPIEISKYYGKIEADGDNNFLVFPHNCYSEEKYNALDNALHDLQEVILRKEGYKK